METFNICSSASCEAYNTYGYQEQEICNMLCLLNRNGKLGAASYDFREKSVCLYEEMPDVAPQHLVTATLYREVSPKYILTFGNRTQSYVKTLIEIRNSATETFTTSSNGQQPENLFLVSLNDYPYDMCRKLVSKLILKTFRPDKLEEGDPKQELLMHSIVNPNHKLSVQAFGALYKYLEKNWRSLEPRYTEFVCLNVSQVSMKNHVFLDSASFRALQIFSSRSHEAGFKRGDPSSNREGLSLYKLFSTHCKSKIGLVQLRHNLLMPINDTEELTKRLNFIKFLIQPANVDFVKSLQDSIKHLSDVGNVLIKIQNSRAKNRDWNVLYMTIHHTICINEISSPYRGRSPLLAELNDAVTENLMGLRDSIYNALDFRAGSKRDRPVLKFGLDENLDAKFLRRQDIAKHVTAAAGLAVQDLPDYINECKIVYLPEMGHLMALKEWELGCDPEQLQHLGFQFMFSLGGMIHYKNPLCVELDKCLGDINAEIIDHENRIIRRLSSFAIKYERDIRNPLKIIGLMDCLIAMAKVSLDNNFVPPEFNRDGVHDIEKCKHPLLAQVFTNFEENNFVSKRSANLVKIITGPNGSGKSIYLKQVALVIYLAHVGCFVPAQKANVGLTRSIHCRIQTVESAAVRLSSFMMEVSQMYQEFHYTNLQKKMRSPKATPHLPLRSFLSS
ncbi:mutS protein homolog 5-like isoform X2 [Cylas formicarius]|uniref:mutS protein homolog 5-like isoform X2 n=1 Tax=Cylas formicarius TaxID=197179 RepID=UPI0029589380|nr:mutS protein homolog 5-like isoform X2 [Cylas formicarius]